MSTFFVFAASRYSKKADSRDPPNGCRAVALLYVFSIAGTGGGQVRVWS